MATIGTLIPDVDAAPVAERNKQIILVNLQGTLNAKGKSETPHRPIHLIGVFAFHL